MVHSRHLHTPCMECDSRARNTSSRAPPDQKIWSGSANIFVAAEATYFTKPSNLWVTVRSANIRFLCRILEAEAKPWRQSITKLRFVNAGTNLKFLGGTVPSHWNALAESWGPGCVLPVRDGHVTCWHWHPPKPLSTLAPRRLQHQRGSKPWVAHLGASGSRLEWSFSEDCYGLLLQRWKDWQIYPLHQKWP